MQHPVVPELAHARPRAFHWVVTATAVAAVVALSSLLRPDAVTTAHAADRAPRGEAGAPDPAAVDFPLDCGPVEVAVVRKAVGDIDGDGHPETAAVVHCDAPMGTPPQGLYVLAEGAGGPRTVATLVDPAELRTVSELTIRGGDVTATLLGYSSADVPRCCPDTEDELNWRWEGGAFVRTAAGPSPVLRTVVS
ncbi:MULTISPECIES: hypothetical protein [unclassified Streptomyces]|uniref:hypothetical protein n=1 Tax=unclassified Streptomyces TaxID=2593676 RepID=UPI00190626D4|nr:hypothetical protein [Streptomyces sp. HSG2]